MSRAILNPFLEFLGAFEVKHSYFPCAPITPVERAASTKQVGLKEAVFVPFDQQKSAENEEKKKAT